MESEESEEVTSLPEEEIASEEGAVNGAEVEYDWAEEGAWKDMEKADEDEEEDERDEATRQAGEDTGETGEEDEKETEVRVE